MRIGPFHLTYCSNIHPGESWPEIEAALVRALPQVRADLAVDGPMGVGLRLPAGAARSLEEPEAFARFRAFLDRASCYVFTINGFPYGAFHGTRVKERVYSPDWRDPARVEYTNRLAGIQARLLEERDDIEGSVSTVPGGFKPSIRGADDIAAVAAGILDHAAFLVKLRAESGLTVTLAIEPEPACLIETVDDAVTFFQQSLFDERAVAAASRRAGASFGVEDVQRHIGLCFDACHMAVAYEDPRAAIARLTGAGIRIMKVQLSAALEVQDPQDPAVLAVLDTFAENTYLHQVVRCRDGRLAWHADLPEVLAAARRTSPAAGEHWRIHFHVPIFLAKAGRLHTTQPYLAEVLGALRDDPVCPYLEVETYTWDVLPADLRTDEVSIAIARELGWVLKVLGESGDRSQDIGVRR